MQWIIYKIDIEVRFQSDIIVEYQSHLTLELNGWPLRFHNYDDEITIKIVTVIGST